MLQNVDKSKRNMTRDRISIVQELNNRNFIFNFKKSNLNISEDQANEKMKLKISGAAPAAATFPLGNSSSFFKPARLKLLNNRSNHHHHHHHDSNSYFNFNNQKVSSLILLLSLTILASDPILRFSNAQQASSSSDDDGSPDGGALDLESGSLLERANGELARLAPESFLAIGAEALNRRLNRQSPVSPIESLATTTILKPSQPISTGIMESSIKPTQTTTTISNFDETLSTAESSEQLTPEEERDDLTLLSRQFDYHSNMPVITKRELANAIKEASSNVKRMHGIDSDHSNEFTQSPPTNQLDASWLANSMFHKIAPLDSHLLNQTYQALMSEETTRLLAKQYNLNRIQILRGLPLISVDQTNLGKSCARSSRIFNCVAGKYRSQSGHCNNVQNPDWGAAQTPFVRYAPARYSDHVARPISSSSNKVKQLNFLPSARAVSMAIYRAALGQQVNGNNQDNQASLSTAGIQQHSHITTMMSFFGQFIFHDLAYVSQYNAKNLIKSCCNKSEQQSNSQLHPECMPIKYKGYCLDYIRSSPSIRSGCNLGPRDQLNMVSSFLDGSQIYGSSEEQTRRLRTLSGGRLRSQRVSSLSSTSTGNNPSSNFIELLPQIKILPNSSNPLDIIWATAAEECRLMSQMKGNSNVDSTSSNDGCFQAGDNRVNQNIGLTLMHTIWLREHNFIADKLSQLNKHWRDDRIFEEARRIVIAQLQHISYTEFLPSILGEEIMSRFNLTTLNQGYFQNYDPQLNAGLSNELASAVLPFILSTIPSSLERYSDRLEMLGQTNLAETFMDSSELFKRNKFAQFLMGMISQNAIEPVSGLMPMTMEMESVVSSNIRNARQLNNSSSMEPPRVDMVALTIQQARDHGIKPYLFWRQACQLRPVIRNFDDLSQVMPGSVVEKLRQVYGSVDQIDLYIALLETPLPGATIGPTFVCLLARQFFHLKHGDRYWYENDLPHTAFTPKQLEQIRQTSLAKVLCRNSQSTISFVQPAPMLTSDPYLNAYQYCTNKAMQSGLDLTKWRQVVHSAQQITDELMLLGLSATELFDSEEASIERGKLLVKQKAPLLSRGLQRAKRQLDHLAQDEMLKIRQQAKRNLNSFHGNSHAAYRYLPRTKRQTLMINNQSLIFELATNEVVRSLLRQGRDREQAKSVQSDIRDFLFGLESLQLENLIDNSDGSNKLSEFIASAGENFLTQEQRKGLAQLGDRSLEFDPIQEFVGSSSSTRSSSVSTNCQDDDRAFPCDHTVPFRTITGWCNNLQSPKFGQSFTPHDRVLPSAYEDGLSKPRQFSKAFNSNNQRQPLPSARLISTTIHDDRSQLHVRYSLALMQFGQFGVDHDLTRTPFSVALDGSLLDCSACDSKQTLHRDCLPIEIPANDAHFESEGARAVGGTNRKCLHFVRSLNGQTGLGPRQQLNALTAYIDASNIYGSDNCEAKSLRSFQGGRLNSSSYPVSPDRFPQFSEVREILPVTRANPECVTPSGVCFHAGDQRASEQPGLTSIHTIFMRLHNTIVNQLAQVNRHWNDEKLYQTGRKIVGAIMQRITYNEFAPRLLGLDYMSKFDLILKQVGYAPADHYDDSCSASILNEFAAAAFRMGHSLIRSAFPLLNKQYKQVGNSFQLRKAFFNSQRILTEPNLIDSILRGIVSTPIETLDNSITEELTNHLFEKPREPFSGMDLISLNIQRARDHGIPGYNKYRVKCNLTRAKTFDDLSGEIPGKLIKRLSEIYLNVDDIDLFTGGMSELPVHGGIIGPTLGCLIGMQFSRLKKCDRFWHETSDPWVRFSLPQLAEIRKMTLAKVICQESDNIDSIQRNAMDISDQYLNPRVACNTLPSMELSVWRENVKSCLINKIKLELGQSKRINPCKSCTCTLEGPVCRTAKINCLKALKQVNSLNQIMADKSCLVQCAWALDIQPMNNPTTSG